VQGVEGSNPFAPTKFNDLRQRRDRHRLDTIGAVAGAFVSSNRGLVAASAINAVASTSRKPLIDPARLAASNWSARIASRASAPD
jgi:hypothetical protein